jgi:transcriptional regulator with XRE-family HTH domain
MTLKELRKSKGLTQKELAGLSDLSRSRVARLENGSSLRKLDSYVKVLGGTLEVALILPEKRVVLSLDQAKKSTTG